MTSILKRNNFSTAIKVFVWLFLLFSASHNLLASSDPVSQTISISPTLFNMNASPGQTWKSEIRVINVNNYDLVVYPQVVNFTAKGESGKVDLMPIDSSTTDGRSLAEWINISQDPVIVPQQKTISIPFEIALPADASPGSHHAAILIGTKPPVSDDKTSRVQTAQFVTSLIFLRVDGDIVESGTIREFRAENSVVQSPGVSLLLRFENKGNADLQPQGDINIYNMWGESRGVIPINQQTNYGNVVSDSIRQFIFSWKGETSFFDIGRYKAVATLGFGQETKQFANSTTYFWIIPYKQISMIVGFLIFIFFFMSWVVKLYIRRMLVLAGINPDRVSQTKKTTYISKYYDNDTKILKRPTVNLRSYKNVTAPMRFGLADLRKRLSGASALSAKTKVITSYIFSYRWFFISLLVIVFIIFAIYMFVVSVNKSERQYEVTIANPDKALVISSEEVYFDNLVKDNPVVSSSTIKQTFTMNVVNRSGVIGTAAKVRLKLESYGFVVSNLSSDLNNTSTRTVIVYSQELQTEALNISKMLDGALLSASEQVEPNTITLYVGGDATQE